MSVKLVLMFPSQGHKSRFVGGLLDGWGESAPVDIKWAYGGSRADGSSLVPADEAGEFWVHCPVEKVEE